MRVSHPDKVRSERRDLGREGKQRGVDIEVESAGTAGYHIGEEPDERYVESLIANQLAICMTGIQYSMDVLDERRADSPFVAFTRRLNSVSSSCGFATPA